MTGIYICDQNPSLKIKVRGKKLRFEDKKLELKNAEDIQFMDLMIATKPHVAALVRKLDMDVADKIARQHRAQMLTQNAAHKGTATSAIEDMKKKALEDAMLGQIDPNDPAAQKAMDELIRNDANATELEKADLERIQAEQAAKIEAARKEQEAKETGEKKPFSLNSLKKD